MMKQMGGYVMDLEKTVRLARNECILLMGVQTFNICGIATLYSYVLVTTQVFILYSVIALNAQFLKIISRSTLISHFRGI